MVSIFPLKLTNVSWHCRIGQNTGNFCRDYLLNYSIVLDVVYSTIAFSYYDRKRIMSGIRNLAFWATTYCFSRVNNDYCLICFCHTLSLTQVHVYEYNPQALKFIAQWIKQAFSQAHQIMIILLMTMPYKLSKGKLMIQLRLFVHLTQLTNLKGKLFCWCR